MIDNTLFKFISKRYCPHDILSENYVWDWRDDKCGHFKSLYKDSCSVCWDCFITEILRDEEDL